VRSPISFTSLSPASDFPLSISPHRPFILRRTIDGMFRIDIRLKLNEWLEDSDA
jgi:hypothetical protein